MINIAIVGATGMVGRTFLKVLEEKQLPLGDIYLYSSAKSAGSIIHFYNRDIKVLELTEENVKGKSIDYALFSAGGNTSLEFAPVFQREGACVIDNSSAWRMNESVPLVVPQVNKAAAFKHNNIIANPNCSTIQSVLPLAALKDKYGIKSVIYTTYQAVSGSGVKGVKDLEITQRGEEPRNYPHSIWGNCIPHIDVFLDNGYTKEEMKMILETRKILEMPNLPVTATCVRVPVENGHSVEIHAELQKPFEIDDVKKILAQYEGIVLEDDIKNNVYPLAKNATGTDSVYVGRIRRDISNDKALHIWCTADNIRKGAASNAIEIMELLMKGEENE